MALRALLHLVPQGPACAVIERSGAEEKCNNKDDNCDGAVDPGDTCAQTTHPVYRFVWAGGGDMDHMFSLSYSPPPAGYQLEGTGFHLYANPGPGRVPLYQLYCLECTDHLQGTTPNEGTPSYGQPEILGYVGLAQSATTPTQARRLYSAGATDHFISTDPGEWDCSASPGNGQPTTTLRMRLFPTRNCSR